MGYSNYHFEIFLSFIYYHNVEYQETKIKVKNEQKFKNPKNFYLCSNPSINLSILKYTLNEILNHRFIHFYKKMHFIN